MRQVPVPPESGTRHRPGAIRALRPPKEAFDPRRPLAVVVEDERTPAGELEPALTLFLGGAECPFTCVFCDLWRHTLDRPTAPGDLPAQVEAALAGLSLQEIGRIRRLKLYNASNFFEPRAVPAADLPTLAALARPFSRVVVECHPLLVGESCFAWARELAGTLEVAMGLETVHPKGLGRLGKGVELADFDRAAEALGERGIAVRAFVLVGAPFVPPDETVEWAVRSAEHALAQGAEQVALIPVRGGNGEMERLAETGEFQKPRLRDLEEALDRALELPRATSGQGVVTADLWDLAVFADCPACFPARRDRLERLNRGGRGEAPISCPDCPGDLGD